METSELTLKIRLSVELQQQLSLFQQVRQAGTLDESIYLIIQEYFRLMSPQITQDLIPFQSIWTTNILLQQGTLLAQIQQCIHNLNQVVQQQRLHS